MNLLKRFPNHEKMKNNEEKMFYARNQKEWRVWLQKNHMKENKVALIKYKKHTGKPSLSHREAMEGAICFGWIDTTIKKLDEDRYIRRFSKRGKNSRWSNATLSYAKDLMKRNLMSPEGLKYYKLGLQKPVIDHPGGKNPEPPEDLLRELGKNKLAKGNFDNLAPSYRRTYVRWMDRAVMPETRQKRIKIIIERVSQKKKFQD